jgi:hypothetical protein
MALTPRSTSRFGRDLLAVAVAIVAVAGGLSIWYQVATDPSPYGRVLNELRFPGAWTVPHPVSEHRSILISGPSITRFYLVDAEPNETVPVIERVVTDAGFTLDRSFGGTCHRNPSDGPIESWTGHTCGS